MEDAKGRGLTRQLPSALGKERTPRSSPARRAPQPEARGELPRGPHAGCSGTRCLSYLLRLAAPGRDPAAELLLGNFETRVLYVQKHYLAKT